MGDQKLATATGSTNWHASFRALAEGASPLREEPQRGIQSRTSPVEPVRANRMKTGPHPRILYGFSGGFEGKGGSGCDPQELTDLANLNIDRNGQIGETRDGGASWPREHSHPQHGNLWAAQEREPRLT